MFFLYYPANMTACLHLGGFPSDDRRTTSGPGTAFAGLLIPSIYARKFKFAIFPGSAPAFDLSDQPPSIVLNTTTILV